MDGNQSEQHYFLSSKMPTSNIITPAQYPCTVISSNKTSNYTIVPNTIIAANNNVAIGNYQNNPKFSNLAIENNTMKIAQVPSYNNNFTPNDQEYKLLFAKSNKKVVNKRNNKMNNDNVSGTTDNITVAPNQLTFLVQEVLPAQLPDNHPTSSISAINSNGNTNSVNKAQVNTSIISNSEVIPISTSISDSSSKINTMTMSKAIQQNVTKASQSPMSTDDSLLSPNQPKERRDTISEVIQEVLRKAISKEPHDDVFLSVIKARENGSNDINDQSIRNNLMSSNLINSSDILNQNNSQNNESQSRNMNQIKQENMLANQLNYSNQMIKSQFHSPNSCQILQKPNSIEAQQYNISPNSNNLTTLNNTKMPNKRRNNSTASKGANKKQKLSVNESAIYDKHQNLSMQQRLPQNQLVNTLATKFPMPSFRKLVHEPRIKTVQPDLVPIGSKNKIENRCHNIAQLQDNCVKYRRIPFQLSRLNPVIIKKDLLSLPVPKNTSKLTDQLNCNNFIFQNINTIIPEGDLLSSKESVDCMDFLVPPSPGNIDVGYVATQANASEKCTSITTGPNLEMLKPPNRSQSPTIMMHHTSPIYLRNSTEPATSQDSHSDNLHNTKMEAQTLLKFTGISRIQISHQSSASPPPTSTSNAQIDSETGEVVNKIQESKIKDKLLVTFTLNPSDDVEKTVKSITDMLGIDYNNCGFKLTTSGGEISVDKNSIDSKIKSELGIIPKDSTSSNFINNSTSQLGINCNTLNPSTVTPNSIISNNSYCIENGTSIKHEVTPTYPEKIHKSSAIISMRSQNNSQQLKCSNCDRLIVSNDNCNKSSSSNRIFCDEQCLKQYNSDEKPDFKEQYLFIGDDVRERSVVIQGSYSKLKQMSKKSVALTNDKFQMLKKRPGTTGSNNSLSVSKATLIKQFRGKKYLHFQSYSNIINTPISKTQDNSHFISDGMYVDLCKTSKSVLQCEKTKDDRFCCLCYSEADDTEQGLGRLISLYTPNTWVHTTCVLWCNKVYESQCGSLNNVEESVEKALKTRCCVCEKLGAGISCYNPRCSIILHVPCALSNDCSFYSDKTMYCKNHALKEYGPALNNLTIDRRVYISYDESSMIEKAVNDDDKAFVFRMGSLIVENVGQLFPYQIHSGNFHNLNYVYPVGFRSSRVYWSYRKLHTRCIYKNEIMIIKTDSFDKEDSESKPIFRVTAIENDLPTTTFESTNCTEVWRTVLNKCVELRKQHGIINLFPEHIKGEDMFGLTDPHVLRAIESLPGLENLHDYAFKFGKIELFSRMPLPINMTGCMRTEPFRKMYRFQNSQKSVIQQSPNFVRHVSNCNLKLENSLLSSRSAMINKWQQYRRLKQEAALNVVLRRSKVQGLGLFASHDIEKGTMIIEYIGQLIRNEVANKREKEYQSRGQGIYMFRLNNDIVIDATQTGNLARYINHSCDPNCFTEHLEFDKEGHIVIISNRKIEKGEELSYDYKFDLDDGNDDKIPCLCGARNCKRWMN